MTPLISKPRRAGVVAGLCGGTALLLLSVHEHYPLQHWLFPRYAMYWACASVFSIACLAIGHATLRTRLGSDLPWLERLALGFAVGVFEMQLLLFAGGMLGLYGAVFFFALPALVLALFAKRLLSDTRRASHHLRARVLQRGPSLVGWLVIALGFVSLLALYLPVMTPLNSSFDARWRHMTLAEQYVLHGGIRRFSEGWQFAAAPPLTALLYAWGFMLPASQLFDRAELCGHIEYVIFLWTTLLCVPALVRRLVPNANPALVWAARFLFPGVFLYDSNLSTGADHIGALFSVPLLLLCLRMWRAPNLRIGVLLGAMIAAAVGAKETTALMLAPFPIVLVVIRFVLDGVRTLRGRAEGRAPLLASVGAGVASIVLTAPHWLRNLIWYGDPLYPTLYKHFASRPWSDEAAYAYEHALRSMFWAPSPGMAGVKEALTALVTFAFTPHDWWNMHRDVPVFGFLFTLLLLVLPFLRGTKRIWVLVLYVHASIFCWYFVHHEDRYLQAFAPLAAAMVAACITLIFRQTGKIAHGALVLLLSAQAVWGLDIYFYPTHSMVGAAPIKAVVELLGRGFEGKYEQRFTYQKEQQDLGRALPKDAVVLLHESRNPLGVNRFMVDDFYGDQYSIDYTTLLTPARIYEKLRKHGVTHIAWTRGHSEAFTSLAGDIAFFELVQRHARKRRNVGSFVLVEMPKRAPGKQVNTQVAVLGCGTEYATGLYELSDLTVPSFGPNEHRHPKPRSLLEATGDWRDGVFAIAVDPGCSHPQATSGFRGFDLLATRGSRWGRGYQVWLRRR